MNTINYQLALKWILGLGVAWLISFGFVANAAGIAGIIFLGFAIALAQRLALDLEQDFGYLGLITICWTISYFIADFATKASFSMNEKLGEVVLFGIIGGATSSAIMAWRLFTNGQGKLLWIACFFLIGGVAGGASMTLYWFFTETAIQSKELSFLKTLAGVA